MPATVHQARPPELSWRGARGLFRYDRSHFLGQGRRVQDGHRLDRAIKIDDGSAFVHGCHGTRVGR